MYHDTLTEKINMSENFELIIPSPYVNHNTQHYSPIKSTIQMSHFHEMDTQNK